MMCTNTLIYLHMAAVGGEMRKTFTIAAVHTISGCTERELYVESTKESSQRKTLCVFCCQCVCKNGVVGGEVVPTKVCLSICETICLCVCERGFTLKETAKGGGCKAALNQLPLTIPTCCGGLTHRPEPARRGTLEECLRTSAARQMYFLFIFHIIIFFINVICIQPKEYLGYHLCCSLKKVTLPDSITNVKCLALRQHIPGKVKHISG